MFFRRLIQNTKSLVPNLRAMTNKSPLVDLSIDNDGISIMTLQRPPVNSLNLKLLQEINIKLDDVAKNNSNGLVITSSSPKVFSAGGDIMEMYKRDFKRVEEFWRTLHEVFFKLYRSSYITAAAINGHASGGGCLICISTDHRVMVEGKFSIGLNETTLGFALPLSVMNVYSHIIAVRQTELALTSARMFSVDEALKVGLIDEVASDKADAIAKCKAYIGKFNKISPVARAITKQKMREVVLKNSNDRTEKDLEEFLGFIKSPQVQQNLEMYIQSLKTKAAK